MHFLDFICTIIFFFKFQVICKPTVAGQVGYSYNDAQKFEGERRPAKAFLQHWCENSRIAPTFKTLLNVLKGNPDNRQEFCRMDIVQDIHRWLDDKNLTAQAEIVARVIEDFSDQTCVKSLECTPQWERQLHQNRPTQHDERIIQHEHSRFHNEVSSRTVPIPHHSPLCCDSDEDSDTDLKKVQLC